MQRIHIVSLWLLLAALNSLLFGPLFAARIVEPFWWPALAGVAAWFWLVRRDAGSISRWSGSLIIGFVLSGLCFVAGWVASVPYAGSIGLWLLAMAVSPGLFFQRLLLTVPWLVAAGLPSRLAIPLWQKATTAIHHHVQLQSVLSGRYVWSDGTRLIMESGSLDVAAMCNTPLSWCGIVLVFWLLCLPRRRSFLFALSAGTALPISVILGTGLVWFCVKTPSMGTLLGQYPVLWPVLQLPLLLIFAPLCQQFSRGLLEKRKNKWRTDADIDVFDEPFSGKRDSAHGGTLAILRHRLKVFITRPHTVVLEWCFSRNPGQLFAGIPLIAILIAGRVLAGRAEMQLPAEVSRITTVLNTAEAEGNLARQEAMLRTMCSLQPRVESWRFRLAMLTWVSGRRDECRQLLRGLTADGIPGFAAARLWLVKNARSGNRLLELSENEQIRQLQAALETDTGTPETFILLAGLYVNQQEILLAEKLYLRAADLDPKSVEHLLTFAQITAPTQSVLVRIERCLASLAASLQKDPRDFASLSVLVRSCLRLGRLKPALEYIATAKKTENSEPLRNLEAEVLEAAVRLRSTTAFLPSDELLSTAELALSLSPELPQALDLAVLMQLFDGAEFSPQSTRRATDAWRSRIPADDLKNRGLALALILTKDFTAAAELLQKSDQLRPVEQLALAHALYQSGHVEQALRVADAATPQELVSSPSGSRNTLLFYRVAGNLDRGREKCGIPGTTPELLQLEASAALLEFDLITGYPGDFSPSKSAWKPVAGRQLSENSLKLLETALRQPASQAAASRRLYQLRRQDPAVRDMADHLITRLRVELGDPTPLLLVLGTLSLNDAAWTDATHFLQVAHTTSPGNPAVLNNLAIAIVRSDAGERFREALKLADAALALVPDNADLLATRGEVHVALANWADASRDLQRALLLQPRQPDALRLLPLVQRSLMNRNGPELIPDRQSDAGSLKRAIR